MKKRIPALILALCLALAPAGCGRQEKPDTQPSSIELGSSQPEDRQPPAPEEPEAPDVTGPEEAADRKSVV